jgi:CheY-like chemotaxis protein
MDLRSLLLCSDEKIVRVLRRVLSDLEIGVEHCTHADAALRRLTRQRFEAVIVDCADEDAAVQVFKSVRTAPCNKRAIAVAIVDGQTGLRGAFEMGAHFVLYKPISTERSKASFRAARALMKRERRRNSRIPIQIPVLFGSSGQRAITTDLSEGGMAVQFSRGPKEKGSLHLSFTLPDSSKALELTGEIAWQTAGGHTGIRFLELSSEVRQQLGAWINENAPASEKDDPPVSCRLTDLSLGACYLELNSPFPVRTHVVLSMRVSDLEARVDGIVRVMHPDTGMGVEFTRKTADQREHVEKFLHTLMTNSGALPDLMVEPESLESNITDNSAVAASMEEMEDPLLELFNRKATVTTEAFLSELRKQRSTQALDSESVLEA